MTPVSIESVTKRFDQTLALDRVSLTINAGEVFFLLGPSGCGKTTLLRSIAGFVEPDEGKIRIGDRDVTRTPAHQRDTGMMFQSYALWPHLNVAENVGFGLRERGIKGKVLRQRVAEALDSVRMSSFSERKINQLSGGQQQRIALARALVIRPRALLLDEPLSNLDAQLRLEMRTEIRRVCKEANLTAIYVTHDQKEALSISDRMAILHAGRVVQVGTPEEVYRRPVNRVVANFIGETNFLNGSVRNQNGPTVEIATPVGDLKARCHGPTLSEGAAVTLSIRPEALRLERSPEAVNSFPASLESFTYLGDSAQMTLKAGQETLKVTELNPHPSDLQPMDELSLSVLPEDVVILQE